MSRRKNDLSQRLEAVIKTLVPQQEQKPNQKEKISFQSERLKPFIPKNFTAKQTEDYVIKALEYYHRYQLRQKERDR